MAGRAGWVDRATGGIATVEPGGYGVPQRRLVVGGDLVYDGRLVAGVARGGGGGDAGVGVSLGVDRRDGGDILRLHLHGLVGLGGAGVEEPAGKLRLVERGPRPIGGEEEGDRSAFVFLT